MVLRRIYDIRHYFFMNKVIGLIVISERRWALWAPATAMMATVAASARPSGDDRRFAARLKLLDHGAFRSSRWLASSRKTEAVHV
jgi:hypothetical protein